MIYGVFYNDHRLVRDEAVVVLHYYCYCSLDLLPVGAYQPEPVEQLEPVEPVVQLVEPVELVIVGALEVGMDLHQEDRLAQHPGAQGQDIQRLEDELLQDCQHYLVPFYLYQLFLYQKIIYYFINFTH